MNTSSSRFLLIYGGAVFALGAFLHKLDEVEKRLRAEVAYWRDRTIAVEQAVRPLLYDESGAPRELG